ncbi:MAG: glycosyltransferase family 4 protein [Melioribacteraceae bacterium]
MRIVILSHYSTFQFKDLLVLKQNQNEHPYPWVRNLAEGLALINDNDVFVITVRSTLQKTQSIKVNGVNYLFVKSSSWFLRFLTLGLIEIFKLNNMINKIKPDLVHSLDLDFYGFCATISKFKHLITIHGIPKVFWRFSKQTIGARIKKKIVYFILENTEYFIIISPYVYNFLKTNKKTNYIYEFIENPISMNYFSYSMNLVEKKRQLIWIGTIQERKGVTELIQVIASIPTITINMIFSYVDNEYFLLIRKLIEEYKLSNRINLLGYKNEVEIINLLDESYLLVLTSKEETAPMVISESFARGVPVVSFDIGGINYMIDNCETGFTVEYGNILEFSNRVNELLSDEELYTITSIKCKEKAKNSYHPKKVAEKTSLFYNHIIKEEYET